MRFWHPYALRVQGGHLIRSWHLRHLVRQLALRPRRVLDAGCGSGRDALYWASLWPDAQITGIDLDPLEIARAERRRQRHRLTNARFLQADLLTFSTGTLYDLIYSIEVLEHLPDPFQALRHLASLLSPEGVLILHVPHVPQRRHWRRFESWDQPDHRHEGFSVATLLRGCQQVGLEVRGIRYTFGPFGSLGWELFELIRDYGGLAKRLLMPGIWALGQLDVHARNRWGNNLLLWATLAS